MVTWILEQVCAASSFLVASKLEINIPRTVSIMSMNENLIRILPGPVNIIKKRSRSPPGTVSIIKIPPGSVSIKKSFGRTARSREYKIFFTRTPPGLMYKEKLSRIPPRPVSIKETMCKTARSREYKYKFNKKSTRTSEYNEKLSRIPPGTVSVFENFSRFSPRPVSIKENLCRTARTHELKKKIDQNSARASQ